MPRANRYMLPGHLYHVTHRCHDRAFLLKFARDRNLYRRMLRERLARHPVALLGYCLTSNHVHLLARVRSGDAQALARFMQDLEGDFAQAYNLRKHRTGAYWSDRYHAVMVERGEHLWRCLRYIDLNMVRAGAVGTPSDWAWCGYHELCGRRRRYRLVDRDALVEVLGQGRPMDIIIADYTASVEKALTAGVLERDSRWTEALAVGTETFAAQVAARIRNRIAVQTCQVGDTWLVREAASAYGGFLAPKKAAKGVNSAFWRV